MLSKVMELDTYSPTASQEAIGYKWVYYIKFDFDSIFKALQNSFVILGNTHIEV